MDLAKAFKIIQQYHRVRESFDNNPSEENEVAYQNFRKGLIFLLKAVLDDAR